MEIKYPKVSIIILNRNWREDTIECLESLYRIDYPNYEVILVDNASSNNSLSKIEDWINWKIKIESKIFETTKCTHNIKLFEYTKEELENWSYLKWKKKLDDLPSNQKLFILKNDQNYWFAEGNNIAMRQVISEDNSEYILLLNNDTVVEKSFLINLIVWIKSNKDLWWIWPKTMLYFNPKNKQIFYKKDKDWYVKDIIWVCVLYEIKTLKKSWLFNKDFFIFTEETELNIRIRKNWRKLWITDDSIIYHKVSQSTSKKNWLQVYYRTRNNIITYKLHKNFLPFYRIFYNLLKIFVAQVVKRNYFKTIMDFIRWFYAGINHFPKIN